MITVSIAVEGRSDIAAVQKVLASRSLVAPQRQVIVTRGKAAFDTRIAGYNRAAAHSPWLVLRDSDQDGGDCPVVLREKLLPAGRRNPALCFRIAVRSLEAWLLADAEAFATTFVVASSVIPDNVEQLEDPKQALVNLCRRSRSSEVRKAMVPPDGSAGRVGPEYVNRILNYSREAWRPDVAAVGAPSLARALQEIDRLVASGIWS